MEQLTLARQAEFQRFAKKTRREQFLEEMDAGYQGQTEAIHAAAPEAQDMTSKRVKTKVEWPFRVLKRVLAS
jgi:heterodisulfide reductase subunit B